MREGSLARRLFAIDVRSLALFRIGLAGILLFDSVDRARELTAFYTEAGVLPVELAAPLAPGPLWSFHALASSSPLAEGLLFAVQLAAAGALLLGWRTRVASAVCWLLLASVHQRNPLLAYSGGDNLLRMLLLWAVFLPLGARASLDARHGRAGSSEQVLSIASLALLLQVAVVYWLNAWEKWGGAWLEGTALQFALEQSIFEGALAGVLREHDALLRPGTYLTLAFEGLAPLLAFSPFRTDLLRGVTAAVFVGFHAMLGLVFSIGIFPAVCIVAWLPFLPTRLWRVLEQRRRGSSPGVAEAAPTAARSRPWSELLAGATLLFVVVQYAVQYTGLSLPGRLGRLSAALQVQTRWGQFADVGPSNAWLNVEARLAGGGSVDPLIGEPPLRGRPVALRERFPSFKWRIYYFGLLRQASRGREVSALYDRLAGYLCREWNARPRDDAATSIRIAALAELDVRTPEVPREWFVHERSCRNGRGHAPIPRSDR